MYLILFSFFFWGGGPIYIVHGQCHVYYIHCVEFHFRFEHLIALPVEYQLSQGCRGERAKNKVSGMWGAKKFFWGKTIFVFIFKGIFIFDFVIIFQVVFIFVVILILRLSSFFSLSSFFRSFSFLGAFILGVVFIIEVIWDENIECGTAQPS